MKINKLNVEDIKFTITMHIRTCKVNIPKDKKAKVVRVISVISSKLINFFCNDESVGKSGAKGWWDIV